MNASPEAAAGRARQRKRALTGIALLFALIALGYLIYWFLVARFYVTTDDAYVKGNLVTLTARIPGTVVSVAADDTDMVSAGQALVVLDPTTARLRLQASENALALAVRKARALRAQWAALKASSAAAHTVYEEASHDEQRRARLVTLHAISRETWRNSIARTRSLKADYLATKARAQAVLAEIGSGPLSQLPTVRQAATAVESAYANLARCVIRAPVTGYVAKRHVQLGQHIEPGRPLMVIIPPHQLWVSANFKENALGALRIGQPARIVSEVYGDKVSYRGRVIGIGAGTGSAFALLPPSNASGNWIKIVQRVPVRISLPEATLNRYPLRVGLSATVTVNIHHTKGPTEVTQPRKGFLYKTTIYGHNDQKARALVARILKANGARRGLHNGD